MFPTSLLSLSLLLLPLSLATPHPHNLYNAHRALHARSITADATTVSGASFDFVIAGGGLAGLALASRLSEWSNVTVLVVEAGGDGSDVEDKIDIPGYSYLNSLTGSAYDWAYNTVPQVDSGDITKYWPRGKGLGGSGAINGMFWGRASEEEYDAWATLNPNTETTWNWDEMNKYINKAENFTPPDAATISQFTMPIETAAHGHGGPIQTGFSEYIFAAVANWVPAWKNLGLPAVDHWNGSTRGGGFSPSTLNSRNQTRSDSKAGYIDPLAPRSNLVILTGQQVTQVTFNSSTDSSGNIFASGVRFQKDKTSTSYSVQANKEVILCGGTVGSPQLLQLSGVGPKSLVTGLGISSKIDLPVGYNLQDHVSYSMYWSTPQNTLTWGNLSRSDTLKASALSEYESSHTGMWTYINEAVGYVAMRDIMTSAEADTYHTTVTSNLATTVSDVTGWMSLPSNVVAGLTAQYNVQADWFSSTSDIGQLEIIMTMLGQGDNTIGIQVALQHPWSRGTIMINSTDPFTQPNINPDYFGVGYDIDIIGYGSEFARSLAGTSPLSEVMLTETLPGATVTGDALGNYTKANCGTEYHPLGTCSMLPKDQGGVVDTNLLVYGAANLRVIDSSIMPMHISAHLMASTYGIAEKGADIIKKKHWAQTAASTNTSATTASAGKATDTSVTNPDTASNNAKTGSSSGLSTGAYIGIGVGAGVGALAILAGLIVFCCMRRKKRQSPEEKAYHFRGAGADAGPFAGEHEYKEPAYAMAALHPPTQPYASAGHSRTSSRDTVEMAGMMPMRSESGYNLREGSPYRDGGSDDGHGHVYDQQPGMFAPQQPQRYHPVQMR